MLLFIYIFILGLVFGSFANVVIYRFPIGKSFLAGRSHCPACDKKILWHDLIPLLSFFWLKARCRFCQAKISASYPLVELSSGIVFVVSFWFYGQGWLHIGGGGAAQWVFWLAVLEILLILAVIDAKHFILPDKIILALAAVGLAFGLLGKVGYGDGSYILSFTNLSSALLFFLIFFAPWFFSKGKIIGLGDAKLAGVIAFIFGFWGALSIIYIAIVAGAIYGLLLLAIRAANFKTKLPLGTFMCAVAIFYSLGGQHIIQNTNLFRLIYFIGY